MKIKEVMERECCEYKDLIKYQMPKIYGGAAGLYQYYFCKHCGRPHKDDRYMDAAGSMDTRIIPLPWPWEVK